MKKAQSFSLQTIVIAVLVLIILVILIFVFRDKIGDFSDTVDTCQTSGGSCKSECAENELQLGGSCSNQQKCCVSAPTSKESANE